MKWHQKVLPIIIMLGGFSLSAYCFRGLMSLAIDRRPDWLEDIHPWNFDYGSDRFYFETGAEIIGFLAPLILLHMIGHWLEKDDHPDVIDSCATPQH